MNFRSKNVLALSIICYLLSSATGCNPPVSNPAPDNEQEQEAQQSLPLPEENPQIDSGGVLNDPSPIPSTNAVQEELNAIELEKRKLELATLKENQRLLKQKIKQNSGKADPEKAVESVKEVEEPKAPVIEVSYSKTLDLKLLDQKILWRAVGPGDYDISVTRAVDNVLVFNSSTEDTVLPYSALELDESVRYAIKVQHGSKKLGEKKSFSLIARGTMLNPTCK